MGVRGSEPVGQRRADDGRTPPGHPAVGERGAQRLSVQELRDREGDAAVRAEVVDREQVRMRQRRDRACLALEAGERVDVLRQVLGKHFDGDLATEAQIPRAVDLTHSAGAQR